MEQLEISKSELISEMKRLAASGVRFGTATCLDGKDHFEVIYHLEKELEMVNIRVKIGKEETLPSISGVYLSASLIENEMRELFGIDTSGIAIDFECAMMLAKGKFESPPMLKGKD
jgi:NADH:ubiquinone oxidoreductase subunit C